MRAATCAALLGRGACRAPHVSRLRRARRNTGTCAAASVADDGYDTLAAPLVHETEVKKSRFIAHAAHAASPSAALAFVAERRDAQARHNCWAYRCGSEFRSSDDGEPSGTAGRPILSAIEGAGLDHVVVLVVRWFGGIKLGAGGLTRGALLAYGSAASACLRDAPRVRVRPQLLARLRCTFAQVGAVYAALEAAGAVRLADEYQPDGGVTVRVRLDASSAPALAAALADATAGRVRLELDESAG